jgi:peroxiredoxin Q/BCP
MPLFDAGTLAPDFSLKDQFGKSRSLKDYRGRIVVLYFYPEDDTPLCTGQACQFRDHHPDFSKIKAVVIGISPQGVASKRAFAEKHALPFILLADDQLGPKGPKVSVQYGAWGEKNMYGKIVRGMMRTTYLIDTTGRVVRRWDRVKTPGHAAAVLAAVKALHASLKAGTSIEHKSPNHKVKAASRQRTRTQGGHAGYSGVHGVKGKARAVVR